MSWCQDDFSYQWNIFKADILGLGPLLIYHHQFHRVFESHCIQEPRPLSSDSLLPSQMLSSLSTSPLAVAGDGAKGAGGFQHPRLQVPAGPAFIWRKGKNQNQAESKGGARRKVSESCHFFFLTQNYTIQNPYLKINLIIRLSSLCYQETFTAWQLHLLF